MSKELVISANRHETKVALIDDDQLVEVYFQRSNEYSLAGSIHKGRVTRVLPGMQSAFVDLGLERDTFLYVSDFLEEHDDFDKVTDEKTERSAGERPPRPARERSERGDRDRGGDRGERGRDFKRREAAPSASVSSSGPASSSSASSGEPSQEERPELLATASAETAVEPPALAEGEEPDEVSAGDVASEGEGQGDAAVAASSAAGASDAAGSERDRRGRRSRRRKRGSRGFPDSKYANESATGQPAATPVTAQAPPPAAAAPEPQAHYRQSQHPQAESRQQNDSRQYMDHPGHVAPIMLPGESLAKYRNAPPAAIAAPVQHVPVLSHVVPDQDADNDALETEYAEPIHYLPENALPDAPVHHPVVDAAVVNAAHAETAAPISASHAAPHSDIMPLSMALDSAPSPVSPSIFAPSPFAAEEFAAPLHIERTETAA